MSQFLYRTEQVRELDRIAIEDHGVPGLVLMQRAGQAALSYLLSLWPRTRRVMCVCGSGNNGGDAYVLAALARARGMEATVVAISDARSATARQACEQYQQQGGVVVAAGQAELSACDVLVDGLLGTGVERHLSGDYLGAVSAINQSSVPRLALDVPSGLHADTGRVLGAAVNADATISFIGHKVGLWTGRGRAFAGRIGFDDLDVPAQIYTRIEPAAKRIRPDHDGLCLRRRVRDSHKGDSGRVLVVGGDVGMPGAAALCGVSAYRAGAGLVTLATRAQHAAQIVTAAPELIAHGIEAPAQLSRYLENTDVVAVGPGLGTAEWGRGLLARVLEWNGPLVIDADGLNLLAAEQVQRADWVLTPHPGEAARMLGTTSNAIQDDRLTTVRTLQKQFGGTVVLKGSGTLVADGHDVWLCDAGNPGMASGGMGDVLTGVIAALRAQGAGDSIAARYGAWLHATAADEAVAAGGERGLLASDLWSFIRTRCNECKTR